jgi:murein DD-endopeptidase MepM/ murein hydrolase activator NlpD
VHTGFFGIYGESVVIDHGLGLMSLYSHMSSIDVSVGDMVKKNQIIGRTGATGLAGGDHLHFGVFVGGVPVNPIEWWDGRWIDNNITSRMN